MTVAIVMMIIENQIEAIKTHLAMIMTVADSHCSLTKKGVSANCASDNEDFG